MVLSAILGDEVEIEVGGETVVLKPTLRAAIGVLRLRGSFSDALRKVQELDSWTVERVIEIGSGMADARPLIDRSTWSQIAMLTGALSVYIVALANGGTIPKDREEEDEASTGGGNTHETYFASLFKTGTGWLGWTPDETLDAPMPAIVSAQAGRVAMLQAIFGGGAAQQRSSIPLDDKVRIFLDHVGTTKVEA